MIAKRKVIWIIVSVLLIICVAGAITFNRWFGPLDNFPRLYKTATCPDGSYTAAVYRRKTTWLCPANCIEVIVEVHDGQKSVVQSERVTSIDVWDDMDIRYPEVHCSSETIKIGSSQADYPIEIRRQR